MEVFVLGGLLFVFEGLSALAQQMAMIIMKNIIPAIESNMVGNMWASYINDFLNMQRRVF